MLDVAVGQNVPGSHNVIVKHQRPFMRIVIPDDYQDCVRHLDCFGKLGAAAGAEHDVTIFNDSVTDIDALAARFAGAQALVLIRERTSITAPLLDRLPDLKMISQTA